MTSGRRHDAIVIGAGPNGLVAANLLADAGWDVLVLEAQSAPGGAVRSDREVHPDFVHDTFSAFYPLAVASRAMTSLRLEEHGLVWEHAPAVLGHPFGDGQWAVLHRDRDLTASGLDALHAGDGDAWLDLCRTWDRIGPPLVDALTSPFPPLRAGARLLPGLARAGGLDTVRMMATPGRLAGPRALRRTGGPAAARRQRRTRRLPAVVPRVGRLRRADDDARPDGRLPGAARRCPGAHRRARRALHRASAVGSRPATPVTRVVVRSGAVTGVTTSDGERYDARVVVADVVAPHLFGGLVRDEDLPARVVRGMRDFELDPGTVKVDWALTGPVPWAGAPAAAPGTVHVADSVDEMTQTLAQVASGVVPDRPFLLTGQMTTSDASRSPAGTESFWAYTHVPQPGATRQRRRRRGQRALGPRRPRAVRRPRAGAARGTRARLRRPRRCPPGPRSPRARGAQREPHRRRGQRRHLAAPPGAGLPSRAGDARPRGHRGRGPLPRLGIGAPRRRRARRGRRQRGPRTPCGTTAPARVRRRTSASDAG